MRKLHLDHENRPIKHGITEAENSGSASCTSSRYKNGARKLTATTAS